MICPECKAENILGADLCHNCGADLRTLTLPGAGTEFEEHLIRDSLGELGASEAVSLSPDDPVALAVHEMRNRGAECVLVRQQGQIVGVLSERDVLMKAAGERVDLSALRVRDIMTPDPVILRSDDTLAVALHKMSIGGFRHIPFVAKDGTTLMVSVQDVFRHVSRFIEATAR